MVIEGPKFNGFQIFHRWTFEKIEVLFEFFSSFFKENCIFWIQKSTFLVSSEVHKGQNEQCFYLKGKICKTQKKWEKIFGPH